MINSENVMRGNWVQYKDRVFQIDSISEELPSLNTIEFGIGVVSWKELNPVFLTDEILRMFGFTSEKYIKPIWKLDVCFDGDFYVDVFTLMQVNDKSWGFQTNEGKIIINTLHELQNIIHCNFFKHKIVIKDLKKAKQLNFFVEY